MAGRCRGTGLAQHVELQKQILARERELGMTPVLQGFTGHVPEALVKKFPGTRVQQIHWIEFNSFMLDPQDPLFQKLGTAFIEEQTRLFGTDHLYDADSFIEMTPPQRRTEVSRRHRPRSLQRDGASRSASDVAAPRLDLHESRQVLVAGADQGIPQCCPERRMLVLDLFCDSHPVWSETQGFYGKPWVWSFVYLFGDNTILGASGPLTKFNDLAVARENPLGQKLEGSRPDDGRLRPQSADVRSHVRACLAQRR